MTGETFSKLYPTMYQQMLDSHSDYVEVTTLNSRHPEYVVSHIDKEAVQNTIDALCYLYTETQLKHREIITALKNTEETHK